MKNGHPVTAAELHAALTDVKGELHAALMDVKGEFHAALTDVKGEFHAALTAQKDEIHTALTAQKDELVETMRQIETSLLTEFHRYAKGQQVRMHSLEVGSADLVQRLASIEDRLLALESRRKPSV